MSNPAGAGFGEKINKRDSSAYWQLTGRQAMLKDMGQMAPLVSS